MADEGSLIVFRAAHCARYGPAIDGGASECEGGHLSADYWRARERAERAAAKQARTSTTRAIHQELAQEYAARIRRLEAPSPMLSMAKQ